MATSTWNIDVAHSSVNFSVRHLVVSKTRGKFLTYGGKIVLDEGDMTLSRVEVEIDAATIDTGLADRDGHLRSPDFLDTANHPKITFRSTKIDRSGESDFQVSGELTIRGNNRPVVLKAEYSGRGKDPWGGERIGFTAHTKISRKEYGLEWNQVLEAGGALVGDEVTIEIEVEAIKAA
jgi:polyisoprenoid-binding protein YceI